MEIKSTREIPARSEEYVADRLCDICELSVERDQGKFEVREIEVRAKLGREYPGGGSGKLVEFDICRWCFEERLIPALEILGAKPRREDWDW